MSFILMFSFLIFILFFILFFGKKLILLLCIEAMMIYNIWLYSFFHNISHSSFFCLLVFSLFMVLDSVYGITLLISTSRNSSIFSSSLLTLF